MAKKPALSVVGEPGATSVKPPRTLGNHGMSLWNRVMNEYVIDDVGGLELLTLACQALDRAEALRAAIDRDGVVIKVRGAPRSHPALRDELTNRQFVARTLARLGLDYEAVKPVGRPAVGLGWRGLD